MHSIMCMTGLCLMEIKFCVRVFFFFFLFFSFLGYATHLKDHAQYSLHDWFVFNRDNSVMFILTGLYLTEIIQSCLFFPFFFSFVFFLLGVHLDVSHLSICSCSKCVS